MSSVDSPSFKDLSHMTKKSSTRVTESRMDIMLVSRQPANSVCSLRLGVLGNINHLFKGCTCPDGSWIKMAIASLDPPARITQMWLAHESTSRLLKTQACCGTSGTTLAEESVTLNTGLSPARLGSE